MSHIEIFNEQKYVQEAMKKIKPLPDDFFIYRAEWLGDIQKNNRNCIMELTGCVFREAKTGVRKGKKVIKVKGTERKVYMTPDEIDQAEGRKK